MNFGGKMCLFPTCQVLRLCQDSLSIHVPCLPNRSKSPLECRDHSKYMSHVIYFFHPRLPEPNPSSLPLPPTRPAQESSGTRLAGAGARGELLHGLVRMSRRSSRVILPGWGGGPSGDPANTVSSNGIGSGLVLRHLTPIAIE